MNKKANTLRERSLRTLSTFFRRDRGIITALLIITALGLLLNSGCKKQEQVIAEGVQSIHKHKLVYFKDYRTNLCFAFYGDLAGETSYAVLASVPCDSVSDYLLKESELEGGA